MRKFFAAVASLALVLAPIIAAAQTATPIIPTGRSTGQVAPPGAPVVMPGDISGGLASKQDWVKFLWGSVPARPLQKMLQDRLSPLDFGAKCDGTTDDTPAFQVMLTTAATLNNTIGVEIRLPSQTCVLSSTLHYVIPPNGSFAIRGAGQNVSALMFTANVDGLDISYSDPLHTTPVLADFSVLKNVAGATVPITTTTPATMTTAVASTLSAAMATGSFSFTVADATGIQVGQDILAAPGCKLPYGSQVAAVSGNTVTSTFPAVSTIASGCREIFETASFTVSPSDAATLKTMLYDAWTRAQASQDSIGGIGVVHMVNHGSGYTGTPTVTAIGTSANPGSGATFQPYVTADGSIAAIAVTNGGAGYEGPVTLTISGGGGSGATAIADMGGAPVHGAEAFMGEGVSLGRGQFATCDIPRASRVMGVIGQRVILNAGIYGSLPTGCVLDALSAQHVAITVTGASLQQEGVIPLMGLSVHDVTMGPVYNPANPYAKVDSWLKGLQLVDVVAPSVYAVQSYGVAGQGYGISYRGSAPPDTPQNPAGHTLADAPHFHNLQLDDHLYGWYSSSPYIEGVYIDQMDAGGDYVGIYWSNSSFTDQITISNVQIDTQGPAIQLGGVGQPAVVNAYIIHDDGPSDYLTNYAQPAWFVARSESAAILLANVVNGNFANISVAEHAPSVPGQGPLRSCVVSLQSTNSNSGNTIANISYQASAGDFFQNAYPLCLHNTSGGVTLTGVSAAQGFGVTSGQLPGLVGYDTVVGFQPDAQVGAGVGTGMPLNNVCKGNAVNGIEYYDCLGHTTPRTNIVPSVPVTGQIAINPNIDSFIGTPTTATVDTITDGKDLDGQGHRIYIRNASQNGSSLTITPTVATSQALTTSTNPGQTSVTVPSTTGMAVGQAVSSSCPLPYGTTVAAITSSTVVQLSAGALGGLPAGCVLTTGSGEINGDLTASEVLTPGQHIALWWHAGMNTWFTQ